MKKYLITVMGVGALVSACSAANSDGAEGTGETSEAYGETTCETVTADVTTASYELQGCFGSYGPGGNSPDGTYTHTGCTNAYVVDAPISGSTSPADIYGGVTPDINWAGVSQSDCSHFCARWSATGIGRLSLPAGARIYQSLTPMAGTGDTAQTVQGTWNGSACVPSTTTPYAAYHPTTTHLFDVRLEGQAYYASDTSCATPSVYYPVKWLLGKPGCPG